MVEKKIDQRGSGIGTYCQHNKKNPSFGMYKLRLVLKKINYDKKFASLEHLDWKTLRFDLKSATDCFQYMAFLEK